ncbi:MAG: hypothetical protein NTZ05_15840 [Chloroflexi bacterium]|nr:hypothetical protein [Chloroflexota bacterium]
MAVTPNSTSVGSEIWVEVRASNPALNTIRVLLGCGTPNLFENAAAEASFIWRTAGCPAGSHTITAEARPGYDANWSRAVSGGTTITLTPP